jgi:hypothetical protein
MRRIERLEKSTIVDWPVVAAQVAAEIVTILLGSPEFVQAQTLREQ